MKRRALQILCPVLAAIAGAVAGLRPHVTTGPMPGQSASAAPVVPAAEQFASIRDPVARLHAALRACRSLREYARLGPMLQQLDAAQMGALLDAMDGEDDAYNTDYFTDLVGWWTERDRPAASAWMEKKLERIFARPKYPGGQETWLFTWGLQAPEDALRIARKHPNHPLAIELLNFSLNWPKPPEALELLRQFPAGTVRADTLQKHLLYRAGISADPAEFLPWVAAFEGLERQIVLSAVLPAVAMKQPVVALDTAVGQQLESLEIWEKVIEQAMNQDAGTTLAWLSQADDEFLAVHAGSIVKAWAEHDVTAALEWAAEKGFMGVASTMPPEFDPEPWMEDEVSTGGKTSSRNTAFDYERRTALQQVLAKDPEAALAWLRRQPKGPERDAWIELAAGGIGGDLMLPSEQFSWEFDSLALLFLELPPEAAEQAVARLMRQTVLSFTEAFRWAGALPAGPARRQAFIGLGERNGFLFSTDERTNTREVFANLPPGPDRDANHIGMARRDAWRLASDWELAPPPSPTALELAVQISDPALRRQTFDDALYLATDARRPRRERQRVLEAIEEAAVPEEWKAPWRAKLRNSEALR